MPFPLLCHPRNVMEVQSVLVVRLSAKLRLGLAFAQSHIPLVKMCLKGNLAVRPKQQLAVAFVCICCCTPPLATCCRGQWKLSCRAGLGIKTQRNVSLRVQEHGGSAELLIEREDPQPRCWWNAGCSGGQGQSQYWRGKQRECRNAPSWANSKYY